MNFHSRPFNSFYHFVPNLSIVRHYFYSSASHSFAMLLQIASKSFGELFSSSILSHQLCTLLFFPHSIHPSHSAHTPETLHFHNIKFVARLLLHSFLTPQVSAPNVTTCTAVLSQTYIPDITHLHRCTKILQNLTHFLLRIFLQTSILNETTPQILEIDNNIYDLTIHLSSCFRQISISTSLSRKPF